jgi:hypothetical protein
LFVLVMTYSPPPNYRLDLDVPTDAGKAGSCQQSESPQISCGGFGLTRE